MPRGFLIKRKKHHPEPWYRRGSEDSCDHLSESGSSPARRSSPSLEEEALNLSTKAPRSSSVFTQGIDLSRTKSTSSSRTSIESEKVDVDIDVEGDGEEKEYKGVNLNQLYIQATKKAHEIVEKEQERLHQQHQQLQKKSERDGEREKELGEFNNNNVLPLPHPGNAIRHPLVDFNRALQQHYLPPPLPSSAPLSISTGSTWSPFYLAALDHLSVASSPSSSSHGSHGSSPRGSLVPPPAALGPQQTRSVPSPPQGDPTKPQPQINTITGGGKKRAYSTSTVSSNNSNKSSTAQNKNSNKRVKAVRKIDFNGDSSSPVSGTYIREETDDGIRVVSGDIDTNLNIVEVTPEAEAELARIDNKIGDYLCRLCKEVYDSAFGLAQHRCSRIVHVEYRCPECDKVFNCSANLASHRRWHKPRGAGASAASQGGSGGKGSLPKILPNGGGVLVDDDIKDSQQEPQQQGQYACTQCGKHFKRQAYLRKHMTTHNNNTNNNLQPHQLSSPPKQEQDPASPPPRLPQAMLSPLDVSPRHAHFHDSRGLPLMCRLCGVHVSDTGALEEHIRHRHQHPQGHPQGPHHINIPHPHGLSHAHPLPQRPSVDIYPCKLCSTPFYSLSGLAEHVLKCHPSSSTPPQHRHPGPGAPPMVMLQIPALSGSC